MIETSQRTGALADQPPVRITSRRGTIRIEAPFLFADGDNAVIHRLVERILRVSAVDAVGIDYGTGSVTVDYSSRRLDRAAALSNIAAALSNDAAPRARAGRVEVDLDRIVGRVIRVERRRHSGGMITTVVSTGADFLAAIAPKVGWGRRQSSAVCRHAGDAVLYRNGLSIRYVPQAAVAETAEAELLTDVHNQLALASTAAVGRVPPASIVVTRGWRRAANLAAAGGCFFMSFVGLVTPGVPTVPFVLATSYFLVRSSPALDDRLRRSRLFGQLVRDWERYGGMRSGTKRCVVLLTLAIMGGTLIFVEPTLPILMLMGTMGTLGITLILWTHTVPDDAPDDIAALMPA